MHIKEYAAVARRMPRRIYRFSIQDIAEARGKSVDAVRQDMFRKRFDPFDLWSLAIYVTTKLGKQPRTKEAMVQASDRALPKLDNQWKTSRQLGVDIDVLIHLYELNLIQARVRQYRNSTDKFFLEFRSK